MPDIVHSLIIKAPLENVFEGISKPEGMDVWWTKQSAGKPTIGEEYRLYFAPGYDWRARVMRCITNQEFELRFTESKEIWQGTSVHFHLEEKESFIKLDFRHSNWKEEVENFRVSSYCWAMYLRILKRNLEFGETVPYEKRLEV